MSQIIVLGKCADAMRSMPAESIHAVVCDPPYLLGFMDEDFDRQDGAHLSPVQMQEWHAEWLAEALRVLKPGGFLVAFSGTRTYHRLACAAEDVGFEVRDMIEWFFGSGFPKSLNASMAVDAYLGKLDEREVIGQKHAERYPNGPGGTSFTVAGDGADGTRSAERTLETAPATLEAERWEGYGTGLKPAHEPILLARKPVVGTVASNLLTHGAGAMNVRAARVETEDSLDGGATSSDSHALGKRHEGWERPWQDDEGLREEAAGRARAKLAEAEALGRWPANLILSHGEDCLPGECGLGCPVALLDEQSGVRPAGGPVTGREGSAPFGGSVYGTMARDDRPWPGFGDTGGASRFFYTAKASRAEREAGCEDLEEGELLWSSGEESPGTFQSEGTVRAVRNHHPTVKPIAIMRWLVRLVVPAGGLALDPFLGSGTTAIAAALEGVDLVGIEQSEEYVRIAEARVAFWREHGEAGFEVASRRHAGRSRRRVVEEAGQLDLFAG